MRSSIVYGPICALGVMIAAIPAKAAVTECTLPTSGSTLDIVISIIDPLNSGISNISWSLANGNEIMVTEDWDSDGPGFLEIKGLLNGTNFYSMKKILNNDSGSLFSSISVELLDMANVGNDASDNVLTEKFVPARYFYSNNFDGFSFAQGISFTELADDFTTIFKDVLGGRDFIEFSGGTGILDGTSSSITFGLRDQFGENGSSGFLLAQRPNFQETPVPEPGAILIFGLGLAGIGALRRRKSS